TLAVHAVVAACIVLAPAGAPAPRSDGAEPSMQAYILSEESDAVPSGAAAESGPHLSAKPPHVEHHRPRKAKARKAAPAAPVGNGALVECVAARSEAVAVPSESREFQKTLFEYIERYQRYPERARRAQLTGIVQVSFIMDRAGSVLSAWIEERSGFSVL